MTEENESGYPEANPQRKRDPRFLIDGMLGSLAIKLRILGFDTAYDKTSKDADLIRRTLTEERVLVTSDRELYKNCVQRKAKAIIVTTQGDLETLVQVLHRAGIESIDVVHPRCSRCNSTLKRAGHDDHWGRPTFKCRECSKLYWRGSHWKKLDSFFASVNNSLSGDSI